MESESLMCTTNGEQITQVTAVSVASYALFFVFPAPTCKPTNMRKNLAEKYFA